MQVNNDMDADEGIDNISLEQNNYDWIDLAEDPPLFTYTENPGLKIDLTDFSVKTLVNLFFSDEFVNLLVEQTNVYARQEIAKKQTRRSSRMALWKDTNPREVRIFLGRLFHMGPCSLPSISSYWSTSMFYNMKFWSSMSRNRFQLLLRFLHFADNSIPSDDRLYKVRPVLTHLNDIMRKNYIPDKN